MASLTRRLADRIEATIRRRAPSGRPPLRIPARRVYILPSGTGALFGVLLLVMLAGATNYGNNLAFSLTFWLAAAALVSMHRAHRNLAGLELAGVRAEPVFAGETAIFDVELASRARPPRRGLYVSGSASETSTAVSAARDRNGYVRIAKATHGRGRLVCPRLTISSRYPMGLFRCWSYATPEAHGLVYPAPIDRLGEPTSAGDTGDGHLDRSRRGEALFSGHRRFQSGDSRRRIDWKASARTDYLMITEHSETQTPTHWFDYDTLTALAPEARLSQLAYWILAADRRGAVYGLRLPKHTLAPATGPAHRRACLEALALF
ncbi:DUF58 domain-containing protein [Salinisphaera hydrothermalis]|uniref:DUF58 domain-containing protein n=1 Tax=Salinisphaera hydrothermalis TaxID=563188 RepID=UPI0033420C69